MMSLAEVGISSSCKNFSFLFRGCMTGLDEVMLVM